MCSYLFIIGNGGLRETQQIFFGMVDRHGAELTLSSRNAMVEHAEAIPSM